MFRKAQVTNLLNAGVWSYRTPKLVWWSLIFSWICVKCLTVRVPKREDDRAVLVVDCIDQASWDERDSRNAEALLWALSRMMEHDVVFLFTMCLFRKGNIYLHPSRLCHLSLRTKLHVNTTNPQATAKCPLSSPRVSGDRFLNTKDKQTSELLCESFRSSQRSTCTWLHAPRVWMHTVMFDSLNDVSALPMFACLIRSHSVSHATLEARFCRDTEFCILQTARPWWTSHQGGRCK